MARLNYDPTHTTTLRNQFAREMGKRFRELRGLVRRAIIDQDCFGLMNNPTTQAVPQRRQFDFPRSQDKVEAFMDWFRKQHDEGILEIRQGQQLGEAVESAWTNTYVDSAYQKGIRRGRQELRQAGYDVPSVDDTGGIQQAFNQPFHADRVGLLYSRVYNDLKGITDAMDTQISRVLSQGMAEGKHPRQLAQILTKTISGPVGGLGITDTLGRFIPAERRAKMLARTEVIRAHHHATMQEYRNWGAEGIKVRAEWTTAGAGVCPECSMLEGRVYSLDEMQGMIPKHPQCRCIALPTRPDRTDRTGPAVELYLERNKLCPGQ
jgi:SPP1 gp7 family putative phage head morphogenesis protein